MTSRPEPKISVPQNVKELLRLFTYSDQVLHKLKEDFNNSLEWGLSADPNVRAKSTLKNLPTYIHETLHPLHKGEYPALDLGGTNIRYFGLGLNSNRYEYGYISKKVPKSCMEGTAEELFDFIIKVLKQGLEASEESTKKAKIVGFTFSFPLEQDSLYSGKLVNWTKGYTTSGVEGKDVAILMKEAAGRAGLEVDEFVLCNDTVGTLLSGALLDTFCTVGVINGTGSNACYLEQTENVPKYKAPKCKTEIIINIEWGAFGDNGIIDYAMTEFDKELDHGSTRPGKQLLEKMISGMYLGELARIMLKKLVSEGILFDGVMPKTLTEPYSLETRVVSLAYFIPEMVSVFKVEFGVTLTKETADVISALFDSIVYRAACVTACCLSVIVQRSIRKKTDIAVDGSMFKLNPAYFQYCSNMIGYLTPNFDFELFLADDGSGLGAALAAAVSYSSSVRGERVN